MKIESNESYIFPWPFFYVKMICVKAAPLCVIIIIIIPLDYFLPFVSQLFPLAAIYFFAFFLKNKIIIIPFNRRRATDGPTGCPNSTMHHLSTHLQNKTALYLLLLSWFFVLFFPPKMLGIKSNPPSGWDIILNKTNYHVLSLSRVSPLLAHLLAGFHKSPMLSA